jgi:ribosomal protein L11
MNKKQERNTTSSEIKKVLKIQKGSGSPGKDTPMKISRKDLEKLEKQLQTLTGSDKEARIREILGTCRSMGIVLQDE